MKLELVGGVAQAPSDCKRVLGNMGGVGHEQLQLQQTKAQAEQPTELDAMD